MDKDVYIEAVATVQEHVKAWAKNVTGQADEAQDVAQEVLLKLWMMRDKIESQDDMLRLARVMARNISLNAKCAQKRHTTLSLHTAQDIAAARRADSALMQQESDEQLRKASNAMPDKYRAVLRMRNVEQLSYNDIAAITGLTAANVRMMVSRARKAMMQQLKAMER